MQRGAVFEVFLYRQFPVHRWNVRQIAQLALGLPGAVEEIDAIDEDLAGAGRKIAGKHLHGGGLAGAIGPQETQHFASGDAEIDFPDRAVISKITAELLGF